MCRECCCDCYDQNHGNRKRFLTKAEKAEKLKNYADVLKKELTAVEEHIQELTK